MAGKSRIPSSGVLLLGLARSVYTRTARLALEEKGVDHVLEEVDIFAGGGAPADYLALHPFGRIPCLLHGDFRLYETGAITRYVNEAFPGPALQPSNAISRARMNQIISVLDAYAYRPMVWDVFVQRIAIPEEGGHPDESVISGALKPIGVVLEQLELWIGENAYLAGSSLTLADLHGFPMLHYFALTPEGAATLAAHPRLGRWLDRMKVRASVGATRSRRG